MTHYVRFHSTGAMPQRWHVERRLTGGQVQTACGQWIDSWYAERREVDPDGPKCEPCSWPVPTEPQPTMEQLEEWVTDSVCEATDGCEVEPDGRCEHDHPSWLLRLGLI